MVYPSKLPSEMFTPLPTCFGTYGGREDEGVGASGVGAGVGGVGAGVVGVAAGVVGVVAGVGVVAAVVVVVVTVVVTIGCWCCCCVLCGLHQLTPAVACMLLQPCATPQLQRSRRPQLHSTKEIIQPCLIYVHVISLIAHAGL